MITSRGWFGLLALLLAMGSASAQQTGLCLPSPNQGICAQTGLLYWCTVAENGPNMAAYPGQMRLTYFAPVNISRMCHYATISSSAVAYTFSNGTSYPPNLPNLQYAVYPNVCSVSEGASLCPLMHAISVRMWVPC